MCRLARALRDCIAAPPRVELRRFYEFTGFGHFIEVYGTVNDLVTTGEDVSAPVLGPAEERARAEHGVEPAWVFDVPGAWDRDCGLTSARYATGHRPPGTVGFGLAGFEADAPSGRPRHRRRPGPRAAAPTGRRGRHAGGRPHVEPAHGRGARPRPPPAAPAAGRGVPVCPDTDDPAMFHTDLNAEYLLVHERFDLGGNEPADLARTGVRASFAPEGLERSLPAGIDALTR
ncbi:hypothetical protein NUG22_18030 [Saccharothrix longispora]|nr:hypothetical protein [Saccharothrix longispora]MDU0291121.1 hypothetical protein [Saccharothrix longispora]